MNADQQPDSIFSEMTPSQSGSSPKTTHSSFLEGQSQLLESTPDIVSLNLFKPFDRHQSTDVIDRIKLLEAPERSVMHQAHQQLETKQEPRRYVNDALEDRSLSHQDDLFRSEEFIGVRRPSDYSRVLELSIQPLASMVSSSSLFTAPKSTSLQQEVPTVVMDVREPVVRNEAVSHSIDSKLHEAGKAMSAPGENRLPVEVKDTDVHSAFLDQSSQQLLSHFGPSPTISRDWAVFPESIEETDSNESMTSDGSPAQLTVDAESSLEPSIKSHRTRKSSASSHKTLRYLSREEISSRDRWQKVKQLRIDIWSLRSHMHELRQTLREKHNARSVTQNALLQYIRDHSYNISHDAKTLYKVQNIMASLLKDCEDAAQEYGPIEDETAELENKLGRQEFRLQRLEDDFYQSQMGHSPASRPSANSGKGHLTSSSSYSDAGSITQLQFHPLVDQYLSDVGKVEMLRERLDSHIEEKEILEETKETKGKARLKLAKDDQEWLDNFSIARDVINSELEDAEKAAERTRQACLAQGLIDEDGDANDFQTLERNCFTQDQVNNGQEMSDYSKYPRLIPPPGSNDFKVHKSGFGENMTSLHGDRDRLELWLLHQLRSSPLNVNLLVRISELELGYLDSQTWQIDVLTFWYDDDPKQKVPNYGSIST